MAAGRDEAELMMYWAPERMSGYVPPKHAPKKKKQRRKPVLHPFNSKAEILAGIKDKSLYWYYYTHRDAWPDLEEAVKSVKNSDIPKKHQKIVKTSKGGHYVHKVFETIRLISAKMSSRIVYILEKLGMLDGYDIESAMKRVVDIWIAIDGAKNNKKRLALFKSEYNNNTNILERVFLLTGPLLFNNFAMIKGINKWLDGSDVIDLRTENNVKVYVNRLRDANAGLIRSKRKEHTALVIREYDQRTIQTRNKAMRKEGRKRIWQPAERYNLSINPPSSKSDNPGDSGSWIIDVEEEGDRFYVNVSIPWWSEPGDQGVRGKSGGRVTAGPIMYSARTVDMRADMNDWKMCAVNLEWIRTIYPELSSADKLEWRNKPLKYTINALLLSKTYRTFTKHLEFYKDRLDAEGSILAIVLTADSTGGEVQMKSVVIKAHDIIKWKQNEAASAKTGSYEIGVMTNFRLFLKQYFETECPFITTPENVGEWRPWLAQEFGSNVRGTSRVLTALANA